jgi:hypothetical protein
MKRQHQTLAPPRPGVEVLRRALLQGLAPASDDNPRCPACSGALAEPTDDELLTVAGWPRDDLLEAYGALVVCTFGPPPPPAQGRARLMWCAACDRLFAAGRFPAEYMRLMHEGVQAEQAPYGLLRCLRDQELLHVVLCSTGHSETEERWLKARGCRSWLNHYTHVTDLWDNFWHNESLRLPVMALALQFGYWPEDDESPAGPDPAPADGGAAEDPAGPGYGSILVDDGEPLFGGGGPPGQD